MAPRPLLLIGRWKFNLSPFPFCLSLPRFRSSSFPLFASSALRLFVFPSLPLHALRSTLTSFFPYSVLSPHPSVLSLSSALRPCSPAQQLNSLSAYQLFPLLSPQSSSLIPQSSSLRPLPSLDPSTPRPLEPFFIRRLSVVVGRGLPPTSRILIF